MRHEFPHHHLLWADMNQAPNIQVVTVSRLSSSSHDLLSSVIFNYTVPPKIPLLVSRNPGLTLPPEAVEGSGKRRL